MAKAVQPTLAPDGIYFELERFELEGGTRLKLRGRWFGVRGRRFVRPTLTLSADGERVRALADLEHKPWAAEDGDPWDASFPWSRDAEVTETELSVAPDITIELPAPGGRSRRSRRLLAQPRREAMTASWGEFSSGLLEGGRDDEVVAAPGDRGAAAVAEAEAPVAEAEAPVALAGTAAAEAETPELSPRALDDELETLRAEATHLRDELASARRELATETSRLTSATKELETTGAELTRLRSELETAQARLDDERRELEARDRRLEAATADLAMANADRDQAISGTAEAMAERDAAAARLESLTAELLQARAARERTRGELERSARERDDAIAAHGAALVMRRAARAETHERHAGWLARGGAILVLIGALFAALIVLHVL